MMANHTTIFDWDDTLFPSTWLAQKTAGLVGSTYNNEADTCVIFRALAHLVGEIIKKAQTQGPVAIITNSAAGWVEYSTHIWYPGLVPCLKGVEIISARTMYQNTTSNTEMWKRLAFFDYMKTQSSRDNERSTPKTLVSIGDSLSERNALVDCGLHFEGVGMKSIKLIDNPTLDDLLYQILRLQASLDNLYSSNLNQDLAICPDCQKIQPYKPIPAATSSSCNNSKKGSSRCCC